jgi:aminoglycoside phosphotransferase (APT) family kinase protein
MKKPPPWWEEHRRHLVSRPPADGLRALATAIAPGSKPVRVRRLRGGLGTSTHAVELRRRSGSAFEVVVKRFREDDESAAIEWGRLIYAQRLPVPSPEPLAFDVNGDWFGAPALVISKLPGRPELRFEDPVGWYEQIAETILRIASVSTSRLPAAVRRPLAGREWQPPEGLRRTPIVERAIAKVRQLLPRALTQECVMSHGDLHPGNMLWSRRRLSGLTDWRSANLSFRTRDVVYCRTEFAVLFGAREADRFLAIYERIAGELLEHLRVWDLMQGLIAMRWVPWWAYAYREQGRTDLTDEVAKRRAVNVVRRALAESDRRVLGE